MRPQPYNDILNGMKKYEYRRAFLNEAVTAFIYVSSPVKEIRGVIQFGKPIIDSVEKIAMIAEQEQSGWGEGIISYMSGLETGYAVPILSLQEIPPIPLQQLRSTYQFTAPQSYIYLETNKKLKEALLVRLNSIENE